MKHIKDNHQHEFQKMTKTRVNMIAECLKKNVEKEKTPSSKTFNSNKWRIARKLATLAAETYIPIQALTGPGFKRFCMSCGINVSDFPTDRTILESALDDVFMVSMKIVKSVIEKESPRVVSISSDGWTDSHLGKSYVNYNLIYNFQGKLKVILLETAPFNNSKTGKNLYKEIKRILENFGISKKKIVEVTDDASNNKTCYDEAQKDSDLEILLRIGCINHKLHNLLYTDIFASKEFEDLALKTIVGKLKKIHKKIYYKKQLIKDIVIQKHSENVWEKILDFVNGTGEADFSDIEEALTKDKDNSGFFKNSNSTRWNSTLTMIKSYLPLSEYIYDILCFEKATSLILDEEEFKTLTELELVFGIFEDANNIFQVIIFLYTI